MRNNESSFSLCKCLQCVQRSSLLKKRNDASFRRVPLVYIRAWLLNYRRLLWNFDKWPHYSPHWWASIGAVDGDASERYHTEKIVPSKVETKVNIDERGKEMNGHVLWQLHKVNRLSFSHSCPKPSKRRHHLNNIKEEWTNNVESRGMIIEHEGLTLWPQSSAIAVQPCECCRGIRWHEGSFDVVIVVLLIGVERISIACRGIRPIEEEIRWNWLKDIDGIRFRFIRSRGRGIIAGQVRSSTLDDQQRDDHDVDQKNHKTDQGDGNDDRQGESGGRVRIGEWIEWRRRKITGGRCQDFIGPVTEMVRIIRAYTDRILSSTQEILQIERLICQRNILVGVTIVSRKAITNLKGLTCTTIEARNPTDQQRRMRSISHQHLTGRIGNRWERERNASR